MPLPTSIKVDSTMSATAYHITDGAHQFPYAIDAHSAVSRHPLEWSHDPWTRQDIEASRRILEESHARETEDARARGVPKPAPLPPPPPPLSPQDQAALDEHNAAVADAKKRLDDYYARKAKEQAEAEQVAADEALVKSTPPEPQPITQRPLTAAQIRRKSAELSTQEQADVDRRNREQAEADRKAEAQRKTEADARMEREKAEADRMAEAANQTVQPVA